MCQAEEKHLGRTHLPQDSHAGSRGRTSRQHVIDQHHALPVRSQP
ncbi:MAG: hypothetical protein ACLUB2_04050 [Butyricicoccus pullicaecorum]